MSSEQLQNVEPEKIETNYDETVDSFDALGLKQELLRGMLDMNFLL